MGFWYNPNIHPFREYQRRLEAVRQWSEREEVRIIYQDDYDLKGFLRQVVFRESERCFFCYRMRLEKTAIFARRGKFDCFASTLALSPHQNQRIFQEVARSIGKEYGVKPYLNSVEGAWRKSMKLSREMGLYHQEYCGCIFSEEERFKGKVKSQIRAGRLQIKEGQV